MKEADFAPLIAAWSPYSSLGCALMWQSAKVAAAAVGGGEAAAPAEEDGGARPRKRR